MKYYLLNQPDVNVEFFEDEALAINIKTGRYQSIVGSGAVFLNLLLTGNSFPDTVEKLAQLYNVEKITIEDDFEQFCNNLVENQIIKQVEYSSDNYLSDQMKINNIVGNYQLPTLEVFTDMEEIAFLAS